MFTGTTTRRVPFGMWMLEKGLCSMTSCSIYRTDMIHPQVFICCRKVRSQISGVWRTDLKFMSNSISVEMDSIPLSRTRFLWKKASLRCHLFTCTTHFSHVVACWVVIYSHENGNFPKKCHFHALKKANFVCRWYFTSVQRTDKLSLSFEVKNVLWLC